MGQAMSAGDQLYLDESQQSSQPVLLQTQPAEPCHNTFPRQKGARAAPVLTQKHGGGGSLWPPRTYKALGHGKKPHKLQNKDRGWVLEVEALCYQQLQVATT